MLEQVTWTVPMTSTSPEAWSTFPHPTVYIGGHTWAYVTYMFHLPCAYTDMSPSEPTVGTGLGQ